jgi:hypothetical protein
LQKILALGSYASTILLAMASSPSPVARDAAIVGFSKAHSREGRKALERLRSDQAAVQVMEGCVIFGAVISKDAERALRDYH